jgi:hypothetical protein
MDSSPDWLGDNNHLIRDKHGQTGVWNLADNTLVNFYRLGEVSWQHTSLVRQTWKDGCSPIGGCEAHASNPLPMTRGAPQVDKEGRIETNQILGTKYSLFY